MYKHILVPTDGSALSARAIEQAIGLAKSVGAKVSGMTVSIPFHVFETLDRELQPIVGVVRRRRRGSAPRGR